VNATSRIALCALGLALLGSVVSCRGSTSSTPAVDAARYEAPSTHRAVYLRDAATWIRDVEQRARLVRLIDERRLDEVVPYGLGPLLDTAAGRAELVAWIGDLHARGATIVVPIAGRDRLLQLAKLVDEHDEVWLDGLVTEFEFWNQPDGDARAAALNEMLALLKEMHVLAARWARPDLDVKVGAYLGYPTAEEAARLAPLLDVVHLDYSVSSPADAWNHVHAVGGPLRDRFGWFAAAGVAIFPIFYATGEIDMAADLRARGTGAAEDEFLRQLAADPDHRDATVAGFVYFTLEALPDPSIRF
jgi:hypothetical protein